MFRKTTCYIIVLMLIVNTIAQNNVCFINAQDITGHGWFLQQNVNNINDCNKAIIVANQASGVTCGIQAEGLGTIAGGGSWVWNRCLGCSQPSASAFVDSLVSQGFHNTGIFENINPLFTQNEVFQLCPNAIVPI